ncbi:putative P-loop containing nucleoside triphosphate hydrolase [Medicago truncatula]|uniref:Sulfotransferase n=1 Tax=Medicago truncatula TaxID=3880 RepID=A0A396GGG6_MEDTR|nr:cytosolic sulfotransferase 15-like [Medicago truncatula]RHN40329.1 putative P-loop containing nucleoside triphosphate hydrolase [Medicago truncatula]
MASREEDHKVSYDYCKQQILSLPKEKGLSIQDLYFFQSFWCPPILIQPINSFQNNFQTKDSDVIVASMPKAGTTWLKALTYAIVNRHSLEMHDHPLLKSNSHELVPYFEFNIYGDNLDQTPLIDLSNMAEPRLFGTHIPFNSLAKSIKESNCKIIYICRNPLDTFISTWFFINKIRSNESLPMLNLEEAFEMYCKGRNLSGPFWNHMLGYYKESIARPGKVLFLNYEELKQDANYQVKRIAEFLGCPFTQEEESNRMIQNIINLCCFENMKDQEVNKFGVLSSRYEKKHLFRKAEIGDWKNYLSRSMVEKISKITKEMLGGLSFEVCRSIDQ